MRTWWIVRAKQGLEIVTTHPGWEKLAWWVAPKSAIGPFWSYKEAMHVLCVWSR